MNRSGYFGEADATPALPASVRLVRLLLWLVVGLSVLLAVLTVATYGVSATLVGALLWNVWPAALSLIVALRIRKPSRLQFWLVIVTAGFLLWLSASLLGSGDARGVTTMALPLLLLVAVLWRTSRAHFFGRDGGDR